MKTCGNCGWGKSDGTAYKHCPVYNEQVRIDDNCECLVHKPLIPAAAQTHKLFNQQILAWTILEDGGCPTCCFYSTSRCMFMNDCKSNKHYRICAVEMVEGK